MNRLLLIGIFVAGACFSPCVKAFARDHIVRKGETLSHIAVKYGVHRSTIIQLNGIHNPNLLRVGKKLIIPDKGASTITYTVKKGDILGNIAKKHGASIQKLVALNKLRDANAIRVGQKIKIPVGSTSPVTTRARERILLPAGDYTALQSTAVVPGKWKGVVIHHSATMVGSAKALDRYHRENRRMQNGLAYHFVIGNGTSGMKDGEIHMGDRWKKQQDGGHLKLEKWNKENIGICLIGNFEIHNPTRRQMDRLEGLVRVLAKKCKISSSQVTTHKIKHRNHTKCPGKNFSLNSLKTRLSKN